MFDFGEFCWLKKRGEERERGRDGESGSLVQAAGSAAFLSSERGRKKDGM